MTNSAYVYKVTSNNNEFEPYLDLITATNEHHAMFYASEIVDGCCGDGIGSANAFTDGRVNVEIVGKIATEIDSLAADLSGYTYRF